ncbi:RsmD family RNA methyltransferase [uncultured Tessaracoccus sp.]|uniref:RsmD family RNA methyltransferase n=1 Tax=uncultured Tessaracoccus sp. TaxID=905023 RepID=UPI0025D47162|nr:RsmD family RNA methyltransferase [uncultured Tessaracoccus sp.]
MTHIIAGGAKGRRLETPQGVRTRPTTSRVREALFSALASWFGTADQPPEAHLAGLAVLDLFGGSGALGLEAASRGASSVTIVEADGPTARLIRGNARTLGMRVDVVAARLPGALRTIPGPWDLVVADPPYDLPEPVLDDVLTLLADGRLATRGLAVVERARASGAPTWPSTFTETWERGYGETTLHYAATD